MPPSQIRNTNRPVPDTAIEALFGRGLSYEDWQRKLEEQGYTWTEPLKNTIIKREFCFFREEIQHLKSEPNITQRLETRTNSLQSILKRLKGEEWVKGTPNEKEERIRNGRLLGKDAKIRCLQKYVKEWNLEASPAVSLTALPNTRDEHHSTMPSTSDHESNSSNHMFITTSTSDQEVTRPRATSMAPAFLDSGVHADASYSTFNNSPHSQPYDGMFNSGARPTIGCTPQAIMDIGMFTEADPSHCREPQHCPISAMATSDYGADKPVTECTQPHADFPYLTDWPRECSLFKESSADRFTAPQGVVGDSGTNEENHPLDYDNRLESLPLSSEWFLQAAMNLNTDSSTLAAGVNGQSFVNTRDLENRSISGEQYTDRLSHSSDTEMPDFNETSLSEDIEIGEDQKGHMCPSRRQIIPASLPSGTAKVATPSSRGGLRNRAIINLREELVASKVELQKTREELETTKINALKEKEAKEAAEATVLELHDKIASLEISVKRSKQFDGMALEDTIMDENLHQRVTDEIVQKERMKKQQAVAHRAASEVHKSPTDNEKENRAPRCRRFSPSKGVLPLRTAAATSDSYSICRSNSLESLSSMASLSVRHSASRDPSPGPLSDFRRRLDNLERKINTSLLKQHCEEKDNRSPRNSMSMQLSEAHREMDKRLTNDSGYASLGLGPSPRTSVADAELGAM